MFLPPHQFPPSPRRPCAVCGVTVLFIAMGAIAAGMATAVLFNFIRLMGVF